MLKGVAGTVEGYSVVVITSFGRLKNFFLQRVSPCGEVFTF